MHSCFSTVLAYMLAYCLHLQSLLGKLATYAMFSDDVIRKHVTSNACMHVCIQLPGTDAIILV